MKKMVWQITLALALLVAIELSLVGCATTHPGFKGKSLSKGERLPLVVSGKSIDSGAGQPFQLVEVTFENTSDDWLRVSKTELVIANPAESKLSVVLGKDLSDWAEAKRFQLQKDEYNKELVQSGVMVAGATAVMVGTHNKSSAVAGLGALAVLGSVGWAVSDAISSSYHHATETNKAPDQHLYQSFSVPGKLFLRRWILLNKPSDKIINKLVFELETVEGARESYELEL